MIKIIRVKLKEGSITIKLGRSAATVLPADYLIVHGYRSGVFAFFYHRKAYLTHISHNAIM